MVFDVRLRKPSVLAAASQHPVLLLVAGGDGLAFFEDYAAFLRINRHP